MTEAFTGCTAAGKNMTPGPYVVRGQAVSGTTPPPLRLKYAHHGKKTAIICVQNIKEKVTR